MNEKENQKIDELSQKLEAIDQQEAQTHPMTGTRRWFFRALTFGIGGAVLGKSFIAEASSGCVKNNKSCDNDTCSRNTCTDKNICEESNTCVSLNYCSEYNRCDENTCIKNICQAANVCFSPNICSEENKCYTTDVAFP